MIPLAAAALALAADAGAAQTWWWVFLNKGPNRAQAPGPELSEMQKAHVGNLQRLWNEGRSPIAGPLGDDGLTRGIVLVRAASEEDVRECFAPDPFIRIGRLAIETYRWSGDASKLGAPKTPPRLVQATLALVKKGPKWADDDATRTAYSEYAEHFRRAAASLGVVLSGPLAGGGDKLEVHLFRVADPAKVEAALADHPAVRDGRLQIELHPQYVGDGVLGEDAPAPPS